MVIHPTFATVKMHYFPRSLLYIVLVSLLVVCSGRGGRTEVRAETLTGIARVEVNLDPFSYGPALETEIPRQASRTTFEKELLRRLREGSSGSAFCVGPELLITNAHVVLAGTRYTRIKLSPEQWAALEARVIACTKPWIIVNSAGHPQARYRAEVIALDVEKDLALLRFYGPKEVLKPLPLLPAEQLTKGLPVMVAGYAAEGLWVARGEIISLIRGQKVAESAVLKRDPKQDKIPIIVGAADGEIIRIQHSAATDAGVSGGPVLDRQGRVAGVAYGLLKRSGAAEESSPQLNLAIAVNVLDKFLREQSAVLEAIAQEASESNGGSATPSLSPSPSSSSPAWAANSGEDLGALQRMLERNDIKTIPLLEARLRRNRYDYAARALLVQAHYQESRFNMQAKAHLLAAFYQAAWLSYFAPENNFGESGRSFIANLAAREEGASYAQTPGAKTILLSLQMDTQFRQALKTEADMAIAPSALEPLLASAEQAYARASRTDPVATAALIQAYLTLEQAFDPGSSPAGNKDLIERRRKLLQKALALAQPLAVQLEASPKALARLGLVYARQGRLENNREALDRARQAFEQAANLDPGSAALKEALTLLEHSL
jgi:S1-C subfamily serine protease